MVEHGRRSHATFWAFTPSDLLQLRQARCKACARDHQHHVHDTVVWVAAGSAVGAAIGGVLIGALLMLPFAVRYRKELRNHRDSKESGSNPLHSAFLDDTLAAQDSSLLQRVRKLLCTCTLIHSKRQKNVAHRLDPCCLRGHDCRLSCTSAI